MIYYVSLPTVNCTLLIVLNLGFYMKFYRRFKKKENSSSTIQQTVAETVAEVMKQMIPVMITAIQSAQPMPQPEPEKPKQRRWKRPVSIISRLDTNLRREVESMLCDGRYTYSDVAQYFASQGVPISIASVCRYAKMLYVNYNDEEGRLEA